MIISFNISTEIDERSQHTICYDSQTLFQGRSYCINEEADANLTGLYSKEVLIGIISNLEVDFVEMYLVELEKMF